MCVVVRCVNKPSWRASHLVFPRAHGQTSKVNTEHTRSILEKIYLPPTPLNPRKAREDEAAGNSGSLTQPPLSYLLLLQHSCTNTSSTQQLPDSCTAGSCLSQADSASYSPATYEEVNTTHKHSYTNKTQLDCLKYCSYSDVFGSWLSSDNVW